MINFRFHLVSLIAVFLALAVGVVMGYAVLGQPTVDTLQHRVDTVSDRANAIRAENAQLRAEQERLATSLQNAADFAVTSRVSGQVLPVAVRGVNEDHVTNTVRLARHAGGDVPGVVWLENKWTLADDNDVETLATILGVPATSRTAVRDAGLRALAARLASGPANLTAGAGKTDLLAALLDAGFVSAGTVDGTEFDLPVWNGKGTVLLIGGTTTKLDWAKTLVPLARSLAADSAPVVAADDYKEVKDGPKRGAELTPIRNDPALRAQVATVDDLDVVDGPLTAVLVVGDRKQGNVAHYGFGSGATQTMPARWHG